MGANYVSKRAFDLELPVVDATEPLALQVTNLDVQNAVDKNSKCCAFVRAAERQVDNIRAAFFFRTLAYLEYDDRLVRYQLPPSVQKEIVSFDRSRIMMPGLYQLSKPSPAATLKALKKRKRKKDRNSTPGASGIKRKLVHHRSGGVRSLSEPEYRPGKP